MNKNEAWAPELSLSTQSLSKEETISVYERRTGQAGMENCRSRRKIYWVTTGYLMN